MPSRNDDRPLSADDAVKVFGQKLDLGPLGQELMVALLGTGRIAAAHKAGMLGNDVKARDVFEKGDRVRLTEFALDRFYFSPSRIDWPPPKRLKGKREGIIVGFSARFKDVVRVRFEGRGGFEYWNCRYLKKM